MNTTEIENENPVLSEIEEALDSGRLMIRMASGRNWRARRNGKTKTWKTRPGEFRIPVKIGLRSCIHFTHEWIEGAHYIIEGR